jgi:DNA-directed RNA polymerase specialized sigma24 family protein
MEYKDFKSGLYIKYHLTCLKSLSYIKFNVYHSDFSATFELPIALKADAEKALVKIENRNIVAALCLAAQGYYQWEIGEMLGKSTSTIKRYIAEAKRIILDN